MNGKAETMSIADRDATFWKHLNVELPVFIVMTLGRLPAPLESCSGPIAPTRHVCLRTSVQNCWSISSDISHAQ